MNEKGVVAKEPDVTQTKIFYSMAWFGTEAEISDEKIHKLFQALGWKNTWAPWYRRAWWWLKAKLARVVRPNV